MRTTSFVGNIATVSGFGRASDKATGISSVMRFVSQVVVSNTVCANEYGTSIVTERTICISGVGGKSTCQVNIKFNILDSRILFFLIRVIVVVPFKSLFLVKLSKLGLLVLEHLKVSHFHIKIKLYLIIFIIRL